MWTECGSKFKVVLFVFSNHYFRLCSVKFLFSSLKDLRQFLELTGYFLVDKSQPFLLETSVMVSGVCCSTPPPLLSPTFLLWWVDSWEIGGRDQVFLTYLQNCKGTLCGKHSSRGLEGHMVCSTRDKFCDVENVLSGWTSHHFLSVWILSNIQSILLLGDPPVSEARFGWDICKSFQAFPCLKYSVVPRGINLYAFVTSMILMHKFPLSLSTDSL